VGGRGERECAVVSRQLFPDCIRIFRTESADQREARGSYALTSLLHHGSSPVASGHTSIGASSPGIARRVRVGNIRRMRSPLPSVVIAVSVSLTRCGGEQFGSNSEAGDGGQNVDGADGSMSDVVTPVDSSYNETRSSQDAPSTTSDATVTCEQVGRNAFNNGRNCTMSTVEKCSDGHHYEASCSCQAGKCFCSSTGGLDTNTVIPFIPTGCPSSCTVTREEALKQCGYPL
jgi:hypothetical protein